MESTSLTYYFQSLATKYAIVSDGTEKEGSMVATTNGVGPNTTLTSSKPLEASFPILASIKGVAGLYIAIPKDAPEKTELHWSKEEYIWTINKTSAGDYEIIPSYGEDLYWYDEFGIGKKVIVMKGRDIVPPKGQWTVARVTEAEGRV